LFVCVLATTPSPLEGAGTVDRLGRIFIRELARGFRFYRGFVCGSRGAVQSREQASQPRPDRLPGDRRRVRRAGQQGVQVDEQRPNLLGIEHRRLDQQRRRSGRHERRVVLDQSLHLLASAFDAIRVGRRRRGGAGRLGLHSHRPLLPTGSNFRLAGVWKNVTLTFLRRQEYFVLDTAATERTPGAWSISKRPRPVRRWI